MFRLSLIRKLCKINSQLKQRLKYILHRNICTLYDKEIEVIPFCNLKVKIPFNVSVIPLDVFKYPNCDKVIITVESDTNFNSGIKCNFNRNEVHINSESTEKHAIKTLCKIQAPIKANIYVQSQNGDIDVRNFRGRTINIESINGNIIASNCICEKITIVSATGNIVCTNVIQAGEIILNTGQKGNISTGKLQGLNLTAKTVNGNITTESSYCNESSFITETGYLQLHNAHKNCRVSCGANAQLKMVGFDGILEALINNGNADIQIVRIEGNSKIKIENEGSLNLKISDSCLHNTNFKFHAKDILCEDLNIPIATENNYKVIKNDQSEINTLIECPNSNVIVQNLSWQDMFNLKIKIK